MARVVEVHEIDELEHFYSIWQSLLNQTRGGTFFQSLDWLQVYWRHFGAGQKLKVLIVYDRGSPLGIVPLTVIPERTRLGKVRVLTYPLKDWSTFYGPLGPRPDATLVAAMQHLARSRRDWDLLDLRWADPREEVGEVTGPAMREAGFQGRESVWDVTGVIDTAVGWERYFASRTSKFRNNVRRAEKRIESFGEVALERIRTTGRAGDRDPQWDVYDECLELARRSWQGASNTGTTLSHDSVAAFFREAHGLAATCGALDLACLRLDGKLIGFGYNYHRDGRVFGLRVGVDPDLAGHGLGTVLYARIIRDSCHRGDRIFDVGPGSLAVKRRWLTRVVEIYRYTHYPLAAPRAQILRLKHCWQQRRSSAPKQNRAANRQSPTPKLAPTQKSKSQ